MTVEIRTVAVQFRFWVLVQCSAIIYEALYKVIDHYEGLHYF
jgi:hypothetical protein